jgi:hypothetical protein
MMITAKPVIANRYWILKQGDEKVGNIQAVDNGYQVKVQDSVHQFKTIRMVRQRMKVEFENINHAPQHDPEMVYGYPAGCRAHNAMYQVQLGLPLFTRSAKSKSWYAAGWYLIWQGRRWQTVQSPKLITLQRYRFRGPFRSEEEAR